MAAQAACQGWCRQVAFIPVLSANLSIGCPTPTAAGRRRERDTKELKFAPAVNIPAAGGRPIRAWCWQFFSTAHNSRYNCAPQRSLPDPAEPIPINFVGIDVQPTRTIK
jgi:hypothetical protein